MRTKTLLATGFASLALVASLAACSSTGSNAAGTSGSSDTSASAAAAPATSSAAGTLTGTFAGANGKKVAGTVTITGDTLKLSGFSSDQGPDLHVYLANGTTESEATAGVEISTVAWNKADQTFTLPSGTDASSFSDVVIHCDKALAVFGAAPIEK